MISTDLPTMLLTHEKKNATYVTKENYFRNEIPVKFFYSNEMHYCKVPIFFLMLRYRYLYKITNC
jgi:hypothetical protein